MKTILTREIIKHIFTSIGIEAVSNLGFIEKLTSDKFIVPKKMAFQVDDKKIEKNIWAAEAKIDNSVLKIIISDISDEFPEYAVVIKLDNLVPYALRLSYDNEDYGDLCLNIDDNNWIDASILLQAKFLSGMEQVSSLFANWARPEDYVEMYKFLIGFLNSRDV